jgi:predicted GNAT family acetyltransferase
VPEAADVRVVDESHRHRYEARVHGALAGFLTYRRDEHRVTLLHTEVDDAFAGQGVGSALARFALDDASHRGCGVVIQCPFVTDYVARHPEYAALLA